MQKFTRRKWWQAKKSLDNDAEPRSDPSMKQPVKRLKSKKCASAQQSSSSALLAGSPKPTEWDETEASTQSTQIATHESDVPLTWEMLIETAFSQGDWLGAF